MALQCVPRPFHGTSLFPVTKLVNLLTQEQIDLTELSRSARLQLLILSATPSDTQLRVVHELIELMEPPMSADLRTLVLLPDPQLVGGSSLDTAQLLSATLPSVLCAFDNGDTVHERLQLVSGTGSVIPACCILHGPKLRISSQHTLAAATPSVLVGAAWSFRRAAEMAVTIIHSTLSEGMVKMSEVIRQGPGIAQSDSVLPSDILAKVISNLPFSVCAPVSSAWLQACQIAALSNTHNALSSLKRAVPTHPSGSFAVSMDVSTQPGANNTESGCSTMYPQGTLFPQDTTSETRVWSMAANALRAALGPAPLLHEAATRASEQLRLHGNQLFVSGALVPALLCFESCLNLLECHQPSEVPLTE